MHHLIKQIIEERKRQDLKWGIQNWDIEMYGHILGEEMGEVSKSIVEAKMFKHKNGYHKFEHVMETQKELVQLAAVAIAMLESIERQNYLK